MSHRIVGPYAGAVALLFFALPLGAQTLSHVPLRTVPAAPARARAGGPTYFVDAGKGNDENAGAAKSPWRTLDHALTRLRAGDTLYLRAGVYHEQVAVRLVGTDKAPITIASFPGEQAILDGGIREFSASPAEAWQPVVDSKDEFRSRRSFPNMRAVLGAFGDSMIGLHTYHHAQDLRADNEKWDLSDPQKKGADVKPLYCGPGLWYDAATGAIYCRLAATHLAEGVNYRGVGDPRKVPLVVAPFRAVPLHVDGARHIRFQDLIIRGGGYNTIVIDQSSDLEFGHCTVWCSTYGIRATGAQRLKLYRCGFHGSVPPWSFRTDTSLRSYGDRGLRDITRLGTHALIVAECGREFSVYAYPINDDWEIAYCDFTDAHDGLYLGGINVRFHHNQVYDLQDDGIYLSPMYFRYGKRTAEMHLYQNYFGRSLTALAYGGPEKVTTDSIWIYRNVVDLRQPLRTARPSSANPKERAYSGHVMGDHGSPPWSKAKIYHNTFVIASPDRSADMGLLSGAQVDRPRYLFNNVLVHGESLPALLVPAPEVGQADGNLYWAPGLDAKKAATFFAKYRASALFAKSKAVYPPGFDSHSLVADPKLKLDKKSFVLGDGSPAIDAGVPLAEEWPDPLRKQDPGRPDIGALPMGMQLHAGRRAH